MWVCVSICAAAPFIMSQAGCGRQGSSHYAHCKSAGKGLLRPSSGLDVQTAQCLVNCIATRLECVHARFTAFNGLVVGWLLCVNVYKCAQWWHALFGAPLLHRTAGLLVNQAMLLGDWHQSNKATRQGLALRKRSDRHHCDWGQLSTCRSMCAARQL